MSARATRLRGRSLVAWVVVVSAFVVACFFAFRLGFPSPHLVGAAIPLNDNEILLSTGPVDRSYAWVVYGLDGIARRPWGSAALPHGIVKTSDGRLLNEAAEQEPLERIGADMSRLASGQTRFYMSLAGQRLVRFEDPPGILLERFGEGSRGPELLERVRSDGSLVWSMSLTQLLGDPGFKRPLVELRHAHVLSNGHQLLLVVQAFTTYSIRPVDVAVSRLVLVDAASGRVLRRADVARSRD